MRDDPITSTAAAYGGANTGAYEPPMMGLQMPDPNALGVDRRAKDYAGQTYAALTREMWQTYVSQFMPFENKLIEYATDPTVVSEAMSDASGMVSRSFDAQRGATERRMRGLGLQLDTDEQAAMERSSGLAQSLADVSAQNTARDVTRARQRSIIGNPSPTVPQI